jgi:glycerol-3-phosphate acyltransferase PlsY
METAVRISLFLAAFVLGSIPFGIIIARTRGVDLKKVGSRNIGATNVLRSLGKWPAAFTLMGDILKGTLAVAIGRYFGVGTFYEGLLGFMAVLGHNFSLFLGFKGGKGVATSIGVLILYAPRVAVLTIALWLAVALLSRYSSMGALVSFGLLPLNIYLFDPGDNSKLLAGFLIMALIYLRHGGNIRRLMNGTERKIGQRI